MHRLSVRRARPLLRSLRNIHTESSTPPPRNDRYLYAAGGLVAGAVIGYSAYRLSTRSPNEATSKPTRAASPLRMPAVIPAAPISSPLESTTHVDSAVSSTPSEHIKPDAAEEFVKESELVDSEADTKEPTEGEEDEERRGPVVAAPYNPETGEFNWECPCLGGLPQSVCGEPFKESFRCFVTSEAEPKGMDCIDAFNAMQQCFRDHPEVYARELDIYDEVEREDEERIAAALKDAQLETSEKPSDSTAEDDARTPEPATESHLQDSVVSPKATTNSPASSKKSTGGNIQNAAKTEDDARTPDPATESHLQDSVVSAKSTASSPSQDSVAAEKPTPTTSTPRSTSRPKATKTDSAAPPKIAA